ncbi:bifunctional phosphopantothenoylcysteine decarboxylase/phosphopantothenate--cysteine ligase CoaBC [Metabacillus sp. GX 13764]|uniref:bifunctional phosphopantothenoylcysteine decarboxylase/phosphopantothenate--cysteine ligase CoaBC n=1 Tax=Metabacillus kandeliae TaxID=2900151 RepID=UPI001E34DDAC|nr:bifunctional phosphopantothenoylcysteine decarboxylase/phosphopantothenate--cysteine ligase CoaBC [Metabacillus kandeliae]MCD7033834.1 bifunctional phosphopantothenoylcysteine decarboxylase/phosphopantothenate--cysteine ligase CoaBC [Metabacillus kandeliae]
MGKGKNILLCVSGGIAVYKAAALTSKLAQAGYEVKVIMSQSAMEFVQPLTFQALSRNDVYFDTFDEKDSSVIAHIDLADWADLVLLAPATANAIGKLANGIADNMLTTVLLAATSPVWIAPAMNVHMYDHPAVKKNIQTLSDWGYGFIEPSEGFLACGYVGKGRLEEPENIVKLVDAHFRPGQGGLLAGKKVLVTAGPTVEQLDPVRYFSNKSTGKMGYAIAEKAAEMGAEVTLVSGPTHLAPPHGISLVSVETALEMHEAVTGRFPEQDLVIKSAAVADYKPAETFEHKVKKQDGMLSVPMERTPDILKSLGEQKQHQILIGFAAETQSVDLYAKKKLEAKNLDMIVSNNITAEGAGFGTETNLVTFHFKDGSRRDLPLLSKKEVAKELLIEARRLLEGRFQ